MSDWISVKERLPEVDERVFAFYPGYRGVHRFIAVWAGDKWISDCLDYIPKDVVTHWQPLPEPPKEENG